MKKQSRFLAPWLTWLLGGMAVPAITLVVLILQRGSVLETLQGFGTEPVLILLNAWPVALTLALTVCALGNVLYGISLTTLLWGILSYINLVKVSSRGDPFVPGDILLLGEGINAVGSYRLDLHPEKLLGLLALCLLLFLCGLRWKTPKSRWYFRVGGCVLAAALFLVSLLTVYPSKDLYENLEGPDRTNVPAVFTQFGFPYCFLHNFNLYPMDLPPQYDRDTASRYETAFYEGALPLTPTGAGMERELPNILMVMCEAFTDLPNLEVFSWERQENPIALYNALAQDPRAISGHMVVSNTGAGTANTEFDILTGAMTNRLSPATSSAFRVIHRNTDSIPRMLEQVGYRTFFLHPGEDWFYNRESVYAYLGMEDQVFEDAFAPTDYEGFWVTDAGFLRVLKQSLESRQGDTPLFTYGVTIQNHQAYTYDKYEQTPPLPETRCPLSEEAEMYLSVYFQGLRDSARMLQELTAYLDTLDEPYLLVFFGDHQPNLGGGYLSYEELGLPYNNPATTQERLAPYTVPYLIWPNAAFLENASLSDRAESAGLHTGSVISSHYLGALTAQLAGIQGQDGYFDYLNQLRLRLPVCSVYGYGLPDGTWTDALPPELEELETLRWNWQYYRLKTQRE